jgi:hypothetical protein
MSLEITILGADGSPEHVLPVGVNTHHQFAVRIRSKPDSILARMDDYDGDAQFTVNELSQVKAEIEVLLNEALSDEKLEKFLIAFNKIVELAQELKKPVEVLAD